MISRGPWRTGKKVGRTLYDSRENLIGLMDSAEDAEFVVECVNIVLSGDTWKCDKCGRVTRYRPSADEPCRRRRTAGVFSHEWVLVRGGVRPGVVWGKAMHSRQEHLFVSSGDVYRAACDGKEVADVGPVTGANKCPECAIMDTLARERLASGALGDGVVNDIPAQGAIKVDTVWQWASTSLDPMAHWWNIEGGSARMRCDPMNEIMAHRLLKSKEETRQKCPRCVRHVREGV